MNIPTNKSDIFLLFVIILGIIIVIFNYLPEKRYENFEGQTSEALARIQGDMMALLREVKPDAQVQEAAH